MPDVVAPVAERRHFTVLFAAAITANAFLLFAVQPMFARMALPLLGGSPSVWTACMLFFQTTLLLGYLYSHLATRLLGVRRHALIHPLLLLACLPLLPIDIDRDVASGATTVPTGWLLGSLASGIGLPFFVLSTSAPLIQRWFAVRTSGTGRDPYTLYAASNAGSLAALLAYPAVIEPLLPVTVQRQWWSIGFVVVTVLVAACALMTARTGGIPPEPSVPQPGPPVSGGTRLRWLLLAAAPSALMLAVTSHISTDIAPVPLLWIVPLALYLVTFIVAFGAAGAGAVPLARRALPIVVLPAALFLAGQLSAGLWLLIPLHLLVFGILALLCHCELARLRPGSSELTAYYVWLSAGGALGAVFASLLAPRVFVSVGEYPVLIAATLLVVVGGRAFGDVIRSRRLLLRPVLAGVLAAGILWFARQLSVESALVLPLLGIPALLAFSVSRQPAAFAIAVSLLLASGVVSSRGAWGHVVHAERSFFGVYRVTVADGDPLVRLYHGTTLHGSQVGGAAMPEPQTYYHRASPIADILEIGRERGLESVGVIGLGVGSLAAYATPGQSWTFYEIDPAMERIARDDRYFAFLRTCGERCRVVVGDGRLMVARSDERHDLLVVDAFSSDAIPVHLLTREAISTYLEGLTDDGLLAFHISNRHFALEPVLANLATSLGLTALTKTDALPPGGAGQMTSEWLVMGRRGLEAVAQRGGWRPAQPSSASVWTDDFANVWAALRWR